QLSHFFKTMVHHSNMLHVNSIHLSIFAACEFGYHIPSCIAVLHFKKETVLAVGDKLLVGDSRPPNDQLTFLIRCDPAIEIQMSAMIFSCVLGKVFRGSVYDSIPLLQIHLVAIWQPDLHFHARVWM